MANYQIEIERNNVTLAQFLRYVRQQCEKKGIYMEIDRDTFEKPLTESSYSYSVINGEKKCHSAEYQTRTYFRRKLASYQTTQGFKRYYYTDELEEYEKTELCRYDWTENGADAPCRAEICRTFAYDYQTYILNHDGALCLMKSANLPLTTRNGDMDIIIKSTVIVNKENGSVPVVFQ